MPRTVLIGTLIAAATAAALAQTPATPASSGTVSVRNPLDLARPSETMVLSKAQVHAVLAVDDLRTVYVRDDRAAQDVLAQAVDVDDDGTFDELLFQTDLAAGETKTFTLRTGPRRVYTRADFKAYGRFNRERRDDFAWENDRTAHRMYGAALETWAQEPLTSSTVDVWLKRTRRLVINDWYMVDDYHRDTGEGADLYSAGRSRGCGGSGVWEAERLWTSANFRQSRVLANGPIRVMFELTYEAWEANGRPVTERKRITLDAGHHLSRFESTYASSAALPTQFAAGIKRVAAAQIAGTTTSGVIRTWEPVKDNGTWGCGLVMAPADVVSVSEVDGNYLMVGRVSPRGSAVYHAGAAWDRGGDIADAAAWDAYLATVARRLAAPAVVTVGAK